MIRRLLFLLCLAPACASAPPLDLHPPPAEEAPGPAPLPVAGPAEEDPQAIDAGAAPAVTGSGVPLDAPMTAAPVESPSPRVARGTGTPSDKQLEVGDKAYASGDFAGAERAYRAAAALDAKDPAPIVGVARARLAKDNVSTDFNGGPGNRTLLAMVIELKRAAALDDRYSPAHLELGRAFLVLGRADEALVSLKRAVDLAPSDAEAHSALGVAHVASGKLPDAVRELTRAAELAPGDAERHTNLGTALLASGKTPEAIRAFERASKLAPNDARTLNDLGTALLAANDPDRAIPHLQAAVGRDPQRATYRQNLGYAFHLKGDAVKAMALYREALQLDPKLASAWINLGNALARGGKYKEARESYMKAHALDPTDPRVKAVLAELEGLEKGGARAAP